MICRPQKITCNQLNEICSHFMLVAKPPQRHTFRKTLLELNGDQCHCFTNSQMQLTKHTHIHIYSNKPLSNSNNTMRLFLFLLLNLSPIPITMTTTTTKKDQHKKRVSGGGLSQNFYLL